MIGLMTQNNILKNTLPDLLSDLQAEVFIPDHDYDALLVFEGDLLTFTCSCPLITLGVSLPNEDLHIPAPIHPTDLAQQIKAFLASRDDQKTFENETFIFRKAHRCLILKKDNSKIPLTEKENDLLAALIAAYPEPLTKEQLLQQVWNYKPDTETHTLESHIYALRQKLGGLADSLIKSTPTGYLLISDQQTA